MAVCLPLYFLPHTSVCAGGAVYPVLCASIARLFPCRTEIARCFTLDFAISRYLFLSFSFSFRTNFAQALFSSLLFVSDTRAKSILFLLFENEIAHLQGQYRFNSHRYCFSAFLVL
jgi:hypothetical protein